MMSFVNQPPESMISFSDLYNMMSSFRIHGRFGGGVVVLQVSMSMILIFLLLADLFLAFCSSRRESINW